MAAITPQGSFKPSMCAALHATLINKDLADTIIKTLRDPVGGLDDIIGINSIPGLFTGK